MPQGQYAGNPNSFPTQVALPDDSDPLDASEFNVGNENQSDRTAYLALRTRGNPGQNWPQGISNWLVATTIAIPPAHTSNLPIWDPCYMQWMLYSQDATGTFFVATSFDGYQWNALNGPSSIAYGFGANIGNSDAQAQAAVIVRPSDGLVSIISTRVGAVFNQATLTWSNTGHSTALSPRPWYGIFHPGTVQLFLAFNTLTSGGGQVAPKWSSDGTTYTNATTWTPPSGFSAGPVLYADTSTSPVVMAFSGTANYGNYQYTADGKIWQTGALPALLTGEQVVGAVWDHACQAQNGGALGGLCMLVSTTSQARLFVGGVLISTIPHQCVGLATNHGELVTQVQFGSARTVGGSVLPIWRLLQSVDLGQTWQVTPLTTTVQAPTFSGTTDSQGLSGNGSQFLYISAASYFAASQRAGQLPALPF
jgi:hypothetical protein